VLEEGCSLIDKTLKMKKKIWILGLILAAMGCNNLPIDKPDNLIAEDKMTDILYDLTLLDAIKLHNPYDTINQSINPRTFIYKKYNVDSLQFVKSNQYYISQIETYKKMYDQINERVQKKKAENDLLMKKSGVVAPNSPPSTDAPQVQ
jgi:hypothetical protein